MKKIAIIIPTYNELDNIESLISTILINLPDCTIFVIDDSIYPSIRSYINDDGEFHTNPVNVFKQVFNEGKTIIEQAYCNGGGCAGGSWGDYYNGQSHNPDCLFGNIAYFKHDKNKLYRFWNSSFKNKQIQLAEKLKKVMKNLPKPD